MQKNIIEKILNENKKNYDLIADDFDKTRAVLWPEIEATAYLITPKTSVLDVGCGNGRLFPLVNKNKGIYLGFDNSEKLISISKKKYGEENFFVGDLLSVIPSESRCIPGESRDLASAKINLYGRLRRPRFFDSSFHSSLRMTTAFDLVYCLAVLHHIPTENLQLEVLKNIYSFLKPGGTLVLSVWNLWQKKYFSFIAEEMVKKIENKSELDWGDCYIPYNYQNVTVKRYLHAFVLKELLLLLKKSGFKILSCQASAHNYLLICQK